MACTGSIFILQTTNLLIARPLSCYILTVDGNVLPMFWTEVLNRPYLCVATDIAAVVTIRDVFSYDAVLSRDSNLSYPDDERVRYQLSHGRE